MRREAGTSEPARGHRRDPRRIRRRADVAVHVRHYDPHLQTLRSPERPAVAWADLRSDRPAEAAAEPVVHAPELDEATCNPPHGLDDHGARTRTLDHRAYDPDDDEARARHLDLAIATALGAAMLTFSQSPAMSSRASPCTPSVPPPHSARSVWPSRSFSV